MRIAGAKILTLITSDERKVVVQATGRLLPTLTLKEVRLLLPRARRLADKYRDLAHGGRRRRQRTAGGRGAAASDARAELKAKLFSEVHRRLEMRSSLLEARRERQQAARPRPGTPPAESTVRPTAARSEPAARVRRQWFEQEQRAKRPPKQPRRRHAEDLRRIVSGANLMRRRAHVGARGRRAQARRDSRGR
jgi:hypothetical protein